MDSTNNKKSKKITANEGRRARNKRNVKRVNSINSKSPVGSTLVCGRPSFQCRAPTRGLCTEKTAEFMAAIPQVKGLLET